MYSLSMFEVVLKMSVRYIQIVTKVEMSSVLDRLTSWLWLMVRPFLKWLLRLSTRLCELQRILYGLQQGAPRTISFERSLRLSRSQALRDVVQRPESDEGNEEELLDKAVEVIVRHKGIKSNIHPDFAPLARGCLLQMWSYQRLLYDLEQLRSSSFDSSNVEHELRLQRLWTLLKPDEPLQSRHTLQWQEIGFQGKDPATDFRGMGMLGLDNLLFMCEQYGSSARHLLQHSHHPQHGYSFAIVGINLTALALQLVRDEVAMTHLYNASLREESCRKPSLFTFHKMYVCIFINFDKLWLKERPRDLMEFNRIRELFDNQLRALLSNEEALLTLDGVVEHV